MDRRDLIRAGCVGVGGLFFPRNLVGGEDSEEALPAFELTPTKLYNYAYNLLGAPLSEYYENIIAQDADYSYLYAMYVLKSPFPLGESAIATRPQAAYEYALNVLKSRFPQGEAVISQREYYSYWYAINVFKDRFLLGEPAMRAGLKNNASSRARWDQYCRTFHFGNMYDNRDYAKMEQDRRDYYARMGI